MQIIKKHLVYIAKNVKTKSMRARRLLGKDETNYYHLMSRVVDRRFIFGEEEKAFFRWLMRRLEKFMGVRVLTYCIMSNHFHILVEIPKSKPLSDDELFDRINEYYCKSKIEKIREQYENLKKYDREAGNEEGVNAWRRRYMNRMGSLSHFGKDLKEFFSKWYNKKYGRKGTLWEERFKSVLVEKSESALLTIAAYIDLNPVRAKMVKDPKDYRFCGYGEAMGGGSAAREGVCTLSQIVRRDNKTPNWNNASALYRVHLFAEADGKGIDSERVKEVLESKGKLSIHELLSCQVRYFSDGLAIGSKLFVNNVFETHREWFSEKRENGARKIKNTDDFFFCLRDLRKEPIRAPG